MAAARQKSAKPLNTERRMDDTHHIEIPQCLKGLGLSRLIITAKKKKKSVKTRLIQICVMKDCIGFTEQPFKGLYELSIKLSPLINFTCNIILLFSCL